MAVVGGLLGPAVRPLDPTLHPVSEALALGVLAGGAAFVALARRRVAASSFAALPRERLLARGAVLIAKSAEEEAIWRALVLGALVHPLGAAGALAASTVLFAAAHVGRLGRRAWWHLATGATFGLAYLATGRLIAAIAAHGTYNMLVGVAPVANPDMSVSDTGGTLPRLVASSVPSAGRRPMREPIATHTPPLARLQGVSKSFGAVQALDGVDLELRRGEIVALLGPNGAGKSTAVAVMLGLRRPDAGRAQLCGRDPRRPGRAPRGRRGAPGRRVPRRAPRARGRRPRSGALRGRRLPRRRSSSGSTSRSLADRHAAGLSGGQRRRLAVALALAGRPQILFLDEPTAGMDAGARRSAPARPRGFAGGGGAVLLTTQQLAEAEAIATRVVLLTGGRIPLEGTVAEIRARGGLTRVTLRAAVLPRIAGISSVDTRGDRHVVYVDDADGFVAELVRSGVPFRALEVAPVTLEDAFVTLTRGPA